LFGETNYANTLRQQAEELGVGDRVHFLGFRSDVPALMKAVDVIVHSSTAPEPFGRVIVEGMLAKRPVIATSAGGAPEILRNGETGMLVTPGDVSELVAALRMLRDQPSVAQAMATAAYSYAVMNFSIEALLNRVSIHIDTVCNDWNSQ
jgi:glycosyltransferase involved in cell wall biosynthesis